MARMNFGSITGVLKLPKPAPDPVTLLALAELETIGSIRELRLAKGYLPTHEAHRQLGIGQCERRTTGR